MLTALTTAEKNLLRTHPHKARMYLGVLKPQAVWKARVNDAGIAQGEMTILYDQVTLGTPADVDIGMTLWVGSSEGASDLGKIRVKAIPDGTDIEVAENSDVAWADDAYLTAVADFEYWVRFSRMADDGFGGLRQYWDYDEGFQGQDLPPVAIMGPPACAFIDEDSGLATVRFVGNLSYAVTGASIAAYSWVFPEGTPASSSSAGTAAAPIEVTWDTAGVYWAALDVTDDDAQVGLTRRPVFIFERTGANAPYTNFELTALRGDWQSGGWTAGFRVHGAADEDEFPEGAMVVLFAEEWYGETEQSIGGYPHRENIKFVGRIARESVRWDFDPSGESVVSFEAATLHDEMAGCENYPQYLEDTAVANVWPYVTGLTAQKAAYHILKFHSTIFEIADVWLPETALKLKSQEFPLGSVWEQVDSYLSSALFAHACFDKQGGLYLRHDAQYLPTADRTGLVELLDVTDHLRERLDIPHPHRGQTRHVELSGTYYNGSVATAVISQAPGTCPKQEGRGEELEGLILGNQTASNSLAGAVLGEKNNLYTGLSFRLAGNHSYMDIAQPAYFEHTLAAGDTKRGIAWTDERFVPRSVDIRYDAQTGVVEVDVTADRESVPEAGVTGVYPTEPPEEEPDEPDDPVWPPLPPEPDDTPGYIAFFDNTNGFYWKAPDIAWEARNTGLSDTAFLCGMIERGWQTIQGTNNPESVILFGGGDGFLAKSVDAGKLWTDITPADAPGDVFVDLACPNDATGTLYALVRNDTSTEIHLGKSPDLGVTWTWEEVFTVTEEPAECTGWLYPIETNAWNGAGTASIWHTNPPFPCGPGAAVYAEKFTASNVGAGIAEDGSLITFTLSQHPCNSLFSTSFAGGTQLLCDFGQVVTDVYQVQVKSGPISGTPVRATIGWPRIYYAETYNASIEAQDPYGYDPYTPPSGWTGLNYGEWVRFDDSIQWRSVYNDIGHKKDLRYMVFNGEAVDPMTPTYPVSFAFGVDAIRIYGTYLEGGGTLTPWGLAVDFEDGSNVYVTYKYTSNTGNVYTYLAVYDSDLALVTETDLNPFGVSVAYPRVVWQPDVADFGDIVLVFGGSSSGGMVLESTDAGATLTDRSGALTGSTTVVALAAVGDGAGQMTAHHAFTDDPAVFSESAWAWTSVGPVPVTAHRNGLSIAQNALLTALVGSYTAGAAMLEMADSPYTAFDDITGALPVDGGCVRAEWIV